jgi:hypothetical protein
VMFCAFAGKPLILRLYGRGLAVLPGDVEWAELLAQFPAFPGVRQCIVLEVTRVSQSCGFAVPRMEFVEERREMCDWAEKKGEDGLKEYRELKNRVSIDGIEVRS